MTIRLATADDAATIHELIVALAVYEKEPDAVEATPESLRAQLAAEQPPFECLIAQSHGEAVGFALFFHNYSTWRGRPGLYLEDLFVRPEARGQDVGRGLLRRLGAIALERGCARMEWSVLDWNEPAIQFYRRLGARPMEGWTTWRLDGEALAELGSS